MDVRKAIQGKPIAGVGVGVLLLLLAGVIVARQLWPEKKANLSQAYFTDDDGATWYADSEYLVPPIDHNGKTAVFAQIYSYANGSKTFCAFMTRYTPDAKKQLEDAINAAVKNGQPPASVPLYQDRRFLQNAIEVKKPGASNKWISKSDPAAIDVMSIHAPDGSAVDQVFVY
jgi:hypothetical protein